MNDAQLEQNRAALANLSPADRGLPSLSLAPSLEAGNASLQEVSATLFMSGPEGKRQAAQCLLRSSRHRA